MSRLTLYGWDQSTYTRSVMLALLEKGLDYTLVAVRPFDAAGLPPGYLEMQPFGKIPVLEDGGFRLYETAAILRYLDEAFAGPALQPAEVRARARMQQIIGILDSYGYRALVWDLYVNQREAGDPAVLERGRRQGGRALDALVALGETPFLCGAAVGLADCHLAPILRYGLEAPAGRALIEARPAVMTWWHSILERPGWAAVLQVA